MCLKPSLKTGLSKKKQTKKTNKKNTKPTTTTYPIENQLREIKGLLHMDF